MNTKMFLLRVMGTLVLIAILWAGWATRSVLLMGFAAAVIAVSLSVPAQWLRRRGWKRGWAITGSVGLIGTITIFLVLWILPTFVQGMGDLVSELPAAMEKGRSAYENWRQTSPLPLPEFPVWAQGSRKAQQDPAQQLTELDWLVDAGLAIAPGLLGGLGLVATILVNVGLVFFIAVLLLIEPRTYIHASLFLLPKEMHARAKEIWQELYRTLTKWLVSQVFSFCVIVLLVWVVLGLILGMPQALVVAFFAGFCTFIPNIGAVLSVIPISIFTLAYGEPARLFLYVSVYLVLQFLESNVITPQIVKAQLNIPPAALLLFQILVTLALGAVGLLLAVPILAVSIVLVREIYSYEILGLRDVDVNSKDLVCS